MNDLVIEIRGLSKRFGRNTVLRDVDLEIPRGCVFCLVGENGAGKSTLLRCLMGYHRLEAGSIRVLGLDPQKQPMEVRQQVAYVSDAPKFYDWMRVQEVGWFAAGFYAAGFLDRFRQRAIEFELPAQTKVRDLSKGMRSKLALALAMAADPQLLILDEPTSGLDPVVRRSFLESMAELAGNGRTVLIASHQLHELERVADRVAFISGQQIALADDLDLLKQNVQRIELSLRDPLLALPAVVGELELLAAHTHGRTMVWLARGLTEERRLQLAHDDNVLDLQTGRPSLEELYVALTRNQQLPQLVIHSTNEVAL